MSNRSERVDATVLRQWGLPDPGESKKDRGDAVIVGASRRTPGAVILAFEAVMRVGAGRTSVLVPGSVEAQLGAQLPEAAVHPLPDEPDDPIVGDGADAISHADAVLVGPGFDDADQTRATLEAVLAVGPRRLVLDAYALGILPDLGTDLLPDELVLTPNKEEIEILRGRESEDFDEALLDVAHRYRAVVVSYGRVATPAGRLYAVEEGGPGLATAGSGDVLAGAITGFLARGVGVEQAAVWGMWAHARAGERLTAERGLGFLARELADELALAVREAVDDAARTAELSVAGWLDRLAVSSGEVGGGATCALLVAASAAQLAMVEGYLDSGETGSEDAEQAAALSDADRDGRNSARLGRALREGEDSEVRDTAVSAARSALEIGERGAALLDDWERVSASAPEFLRSDVIVGAAALGAALRGAGSIADANLDLAARRDADVAAERDRVAALVAALARVQALLD